MKILGNMLLLCVSVVIALLVAEGGVRLIGVHIPLTLSDRELGLIYRPGAVEIGGNSESGRKITVSINSVGFRDDEWHTDINPNLLVVGDSFVTAFEVAKEERFTELLNKELNKSSLAPWQVLNAGIAGTGPDTYLERIKKFVPMFDPTYTVVVIYNGNDLQNINYDTTPAGGRKNYVVREGEVRMYNHSAGMKERLIWELKLIASHSHLVQLINNRLTKAKYVASGASEIEITLPEYCNLSEQDFSNSFLIMKELFKKMSTLTQHTLLLVSIPDKNQLRTDLPSTCDPYRVEPLLRSEAESLGVPFIAMYDYFKPVTEELYYAGHLNPLGHTMVSDALYKEIKRIQATTTPL